MPFNPFAGSAGRIETVAVAPALATPLPTITGTTTPVNGAISWDIDLKADSESLLHFESSATATGLLWRDQIQGGSAGFTISIEAYFDAAAETGAGSAARFPIGAIVVMDLLFSKASNYGYFAVAGKVLSFKPGSKVDEKGAVKCSITVEGTGALPAPSVGGA